MKQIPHILTELFAKPLLITQARHAAIVRILEARITGGGPGHRAEMEEPMDEMPMDPRSEFRIAGQAAIIPVHGVLVRHASDIPASSCGCGLDDVLDMIDMANEDDSVNSLVFDFRSPGGSVTGIPEVAARIAGIGSKQTVGFTDSECCSGALWLAAQCQHFYCSPSASIGSIGVWTAYGDLTRKLAMEGVEIQSISAGKYKLMGAYWKPLTGEETKMLQAEVDKIYVQFKDAVNARRQVDEKFMEGQIYDGEQACEIGLCDGLVDDLGELIEMGMEED